MRRLLLLVMFAATSALLSPARAADLPTAKPATVGVGRLERLDAWLAGEVAAKRLPGAVVMLARDGKVVHQAAFGMRDMAAGAPMKMDSIFRLYSMTKPITAVAALMLVEEGKLALADPVSRYLPEFKDMKVATEAGEVAAERPITIMDLFRHTSGITYGVFGNSPADKAMLASGIHTAEKRNSLTDRQMAAEIAKLPLAFQPGTRWQYGRSTDVLLAVIEVVSGMRADAFYESRIFKPLGMKDTFFNVPADKLDRVAQPDPATLPAGALTDVRQKRTFLGGGEGLLGTAADYMRFGIMLAQGGQFGGVRLLSRTSVAMMASDHLPAGAIGAGYLPGPGYGFGLAVAVRTAAGQAPVAGSVGEFNWGGYAGTKFWVDPKERLVPVLMIQAPGQSAAVGRALRGLVYQGLVD